MSDELLPQAEIEILNDRGTKYSITQEANMICLVISSFDVPEGYDNSNVDLLLRLNQGYPDVAPDMWWFNPHIKLTSGNSIQAADQIEHYLGKDWQRWSRHFNAGQWKPGIDNIESYLALIRKELERCAN